MVLLPDLQGWILVAGLVAVPSECRGIWEDPECAGASFYAGLECSWVLLDRADNHS